MNPVIRAQLRDFSKHNSILNDTEENQFEIYSIFSVINGLLGEKVDAYDVHLEGNEFGVDGIAILIQGDLVCNAQEAEEKLSTISNPSIEFLFFQAKTSVKYDYGDISKFFDSISGFFNGNLRGESDVIDELMDAMDKIYDKGVGKRNPKLSCYFVATGHYEKPDRIEKLRGCFRKELEEMNIFDALYLVIDMVGARELQQWYRTATTAAEVKIEFPRNVVMPKNDHVEEAYIGYIDAENLLKLYTFENYGTGKIAINKSIFFDNIRDYDLKSKINLDIKKSVLEGNGSEFVFRNNGITVVAKNIHRTGDQFFLEDFQIVNGCQTSNIIFDLIYEESDESAPNDALISSIQVPFRLIGSKDDEFVSSIIIGTNRQNLVRDEQFWALRPFMKSFEEYCSNLDTEEIIYFERRDNQYRNQNIEGTRVIQPSVLMKAVAACLLFQPQRAARDYRGILTEYENKIFLDDQDVCIYHAVAYLHYKIEFLFRNQRIEKNYRTYRFYILAGIGIRLTESRNVFEMPRKKASAVARTMLDLCKDEEALKNIVNNIIEIIEGRLHEMKIDTRERIRDTIRSEIFATTFRERLISQPQ